MWTAGHLPRPDPGLQSARRRTTVRARAIVVQCFLNPRPEHSFLIAAHLMSKIRSLLPLFILHYDAYPTASTNVQHGYKLPRVLSLFWTAGPSLVSFSYRNYKLFVYRTCHLPCYVSKHYLLAECMAFAFHTLGKSAWQGRLAMRPLAPTATK